MSDLNTQLLIVIMEEEGKVPAKAKQFIRAIRSKSKTNTALTQANSMSVKRPDGMRSKTLNRVSLESTEPHLVHQLVSQREAD